VRSARESRASARWRAIGTQEPLPRVRAASDASVDDFERHGVTQDGVDGPVGDAHGAPAQLRRRRAVALCQLVMVKTAVVALYLNRGLPGSAVYDLSTGRQEALPRVAAGASILSIQALRLQTAQAPAPRDRRVGGDLESLGGAQESLLQAKLSMLMTSESVF
jgi:hypothetical protein